MLTDPFHWRSASYALTCKEQATAWKHCTDQCGLELRTEMHVLWQQGTANYEFINVLSSFI